MAQKVFKQFRTNMSTRKMASILYAVIMTKARISSTFGVGIYQYSRDQNTYNGVDIMIEVDEQELTKFEELANVKLENPQQVRVNKIEP